MSAVFLDTVGLLALFDLHDQWHGNAEAAWQRIRAEGRNLITTTYVMAECANSAARRPFRPAIVQLHKALTAVNVVIDPSKSEWEEAWVHYEKGGAGDAGLVDHLSFLVMRRFDLQHAFSNDRHFIAAGFENLF